MRCPGSGPPGSTFPCSTDSPIRGIREQAAVSGQNHAEIGAGEAFFRPVVPEIQVPTRSTGDRSDRTAMPRNLPADSILMKHHGASPARVGETTKSAPRARVRPVHVNPAWTNKPAQAAPGTGDPWRQSQYNFQSEGFRPSWPPLRCPVDTGSRGPVTVLSLKQLQQRMADVALKSRALADANKVVSYTDRGHQALAGNPLVGGRASGAGGGAAARLVEEESAVHQEVKTDKQTCDFQFRSA